MQEFKNDHYNFAVLILSAMYISTQGAALYGYCPSVIFVQNKTTWPDDFTSYISKKKKIHEN